MRNDTLRALTIALVAAGATTLSAEDASGRVTRVEGNVAVVELPPGATPRPGDRVVVGWTLEGLDDFVEARKGTVKEVRADGVVVELEPGEAPVKAGYLAKVTFEAELEKPVDPFGGAVERMPPDADAETTVLITMLRMGMTMDSWKEMDLDGNGKLDYWTRDVAGLHYFVGAGKGVVDALEVEVARADKVGFPAYAKGEPVPYGGYWYSMVRLDSAGRPYARDVAAGAPGTHPSAYAVCIWPAKYCDATRFTYLMDESCVVVRKDRGEKAVGPVDAWPAGGASSDGWTECEGIMITLPREEDEPPKK